MTSVKLGVHLPVAGRGASPGIIAQVAEEAERIKLDSVWSWERLMRPTVPIAMGGQGGPVMDAPEDFGTVYDPVETLSYVAGRTSRITLGISVLDALFQSRHRPRHAAGDAPGERQRHRRAGGRARTPDRLARAGCRRPGPGREAGRRSRLLEHRRRPAPPAPAAGAAAPR